MTETVPVQGFAGFRTYSPQIQIVMQNALRALADMEFQLQAEVEKLERSDAAPDVKKRIARDLAERHQARREPYMRLLAELQRQVMLASPLRQQRAGAFH